MKLSYTLKKITPFILLLILVMLTSCTQKSEEQLLHKKDQNIDYKEIIYTYENPQTNQKFKIVQVSQLFKKYIDKVKENPNNSNLELYKEEIIQPVYKDCFENGEFLHIAEDLLNSAPDNLVALEITSEKLETRKEEINNLILDSLLKSADLLPSQNDIAVCVFPSSSRNMPMLTVGAGKIIIPYGYYNDESIKVGVAHEYHHSVLAEKYLSTQSGSIIDNLIFEGKAVMFEKTVYPNSYATTTVDLAYNKELWSKIKPDLYKQDLNRSLEILHGGKDLPRAYGYSEGFKMIKSYLDLNPNQTPEEWTALSTQEIIEKGKYFENYN